jgi:hypothetical protein
MDKYGTELCSKIGTDAVIRIDTKITQSKSILDFADKSIDKYIFLNHDTAALGLANNYKFVLRRFAGGFNTEDCSICYGKLQLGHDDPIACCTNCGVVYCDACYEKTINLPCAYCRLDRLQHIYDTEFVGIHTIYLPESKYLACMYEYRFVR